MNEHLLRFDKDKTYTFIDCETENLCLNSFHNLPWQIAMIKVKGEQVIDTKNYYVSWDRELGVYVSTGLCGVVSPGGRGWGKVYYHILVIYWLKLRVQEAIDRCIDHRTPTTNATRVGTICEDYQSSRGVWHCVNHAERRNQLTRFKDGDNEAGHREGSRVD